MKGSLSGDWGSSGSGDSVRGGGAGVSGTSIKLDTANASFIVLLESRKVELDAAVLFITLNSCMAEYLSAFDLCAGAGVLLKNGSSLNRSAEDLFPANGD